MNKNNKKVQTINKWSLNPHNRHDDVSYFYTRQPMNSKFNKNIVVKSRKCGEGYNSYRDSYKISDNELTFGKLKSLDSKTKGIQLNNRNLDNEKDENNETKLSNSECSKETNSAEDYNFSSDEQISLKVTNEGNEGIQTDSFCNQNLIEPEILLDEFSQIENCVKEKMINTKFEIKNEIEQMINNMANMIQIEILSLKDIKSTEYSNIIQNELRPINEKLMKMEQSIQNKNHLKPSELIENDHKNNSSQLISEKNTKENYFEPCDVQLEPSIKEIDTAKIKNIHSPELNKSIQKIIFEAQRSLLNKARVPMSLRENFKKIECENQGNSFTNVSSLRNNGKLYHNEFPNLKKAYYPNHVINSDSKTKNCDRFDQCQRKKDDQPKAPGLKTAIMDPNSNTLYKKDTSQSLTRSSRKGENYYSDTSDLLFSKSKFTTKLEDLSRQIKTTKSSN